MEKKAAEEEATANSQCRNIKLYPINRKWNSDICIFYRNIYRNMQLVEAMPTGNAY